MYALTFKFRRGRRRRRRMNVLDIAIRNSTDVRYTMTRWHYSALTFSADSQAKANGPLGAFRCRRGRVMPAAARWQSFPGRGKQLGLRSGWSHHGHGRRVLGRRVDGKSTATVASSRHQRHKRFRPADVRTWRTAGFVRQAAKWLTLSRAAACAASWPARWASIIGGATCGPADCGQRGTG